MDRCADSPCRDALGRVPAGKMEPDRRHDAAFEHVVALAPQAVEVTRAALPVTGRTALVLADGRDPGPPPETAAWQRHVAERESALL